MNYPLMNTLAFVDKTFEHGDGSWLVDASGKRYLDFFCDVGTASLGYSSCEQIRVLEAMADYRIPFHAPNLFKFDVRTRAAERLCAATEMDKVFFCNSGAESIETAIKLARLHQHRHRSNRQTIFSMKGGFHGRTYGALSAGDGPPYHTEGFRPLLDGFEHFETIGDIDFDHAAAVLLSPVFGNNDVRELDERFLRDLAHFCRRNETALIFDEAQTGAGRTGGRGLTYGQKVGVAPDIVAIAKGIAMGAPIAATLARGPIALAFTPGTHFSTFGGNPLCTTALNGMLDWLEDNHERADWLGEELKKRLRQLVWPQNVRGPGALMAFDVDVDTKALAAACLEEGLLIGAFRPGPGPVRLTPPLNILVDEVAEGMEMLDRAYQRVKGATK